VTGFINKGMPFRFPIDRTNQPTELGSWFIVVGAHMSTSAFASGSAAPPVSARPRAATRWR